MNPCVNNGTCIDFIDVDDGDRPSYRCVCPEPEVTADSGSNPSNILVGTNCERLTVCDTMPCGPHGTCVILSDDRDSKSSGGSSSQGYRCVCDAGFEGPDCAWSMNSAPRSGAVKQSSVSRDFSRGMMSIWSRVLVSLFRVMHLRPYPGTKSFIG
jgi:EGF-like domain